ncbi:hypothetical protein LTR78_001130 [Recurvomyces mirabilis]|uniref:Uncharacterized protein n=1 Tax=Recurvomyces mirabilis TaxID=574656 RepID=A0AAE1C5E5_9PEZI|nr:hypothetical protein LTR78_001130 [Recurvomyces mirabilis]KAK5161106.1 hypothetical protein LTS14_000902 [Recurvomyces mirabilis]
MPPGVPEPYYKSSDPYWPNSPDLPVKLLCSTRGAIHIQLVPVKLSSSTSSPTIWAEANAIVQQLKTTVARREVRIAGQRNDLLLKREQSLLKAEMTQLQRAEDVRDRFTKDDSDESDDDSGDESDEETEPEEPVVPSALEVEPEASLASPPQSNPDEVPTVAAAEFTSDLDDDSDTNSLFDGEVDESSFDILTTAPTQLDGGEATEAACESTALVPTTGIPRDTQASVVVRVDGAKAKLTLHNGEDDAAKPRDSLSPIKKALAPLALPGRADLIHLGGGEVTGAARSSVPSVPTAVISGSQASAVVQTALPTMKPLALPTGGPATWCQPAKFGRPSRTTEAPNPDYTGDRTASPPLPSKSSVVDLTANDKTAAQGQKVAVTEQTMSAKKAGKRPRAAELDDDERAYAIQSKIRLQQHREQQDFLRAQQLSLAQHVGCQDSQPGPSTWEQQQQQYLAPPQRTQNMMAGSSAYQHALQQPVLPSPQPDYIAMLQQRQQQQYHAAMRRVASQYCAAPPVAPATYMAYQQPQQQVGNYQHQSQALQYPAAMPQPVYQQAQASPPGFLPQQYQQWPYQQ